MCSDCGTILRASTLLMRPSGDTKIMSPACPACENPLEGGFVELRNTFGDFLAFGWSHLVLAFTDGGTFELDVLEPSQRKIAASCGKCGAVVITNETWVP